MLFSWMKSLITYLLLSGIVINLSPAKNYKRYISFFSGLVVIIILAEPIAYLFRLFGGDIENIFNDMDGYLAYGNSGEQNEYVYDYYDMSYEEAIKRFLVEKGVNVSRVSVITDEEKNILKIYIYVEKGGDTDSYLSDVEIKKCLQEVYNLDIDSIYVVRR